MRADPERMVRLLAIALFGAVACSAARAADDIRLRIDEQVGIYWVDDARVLYQGFTDENLARIAAGKLTYEVLFTSPRAIRSLNIATGEIRDHAINHRGAFCFSRGNVLYKKRDSAEEPDYYVLSPLDGPHRRSRRADAVETGGISSFIRCYSPDVSHLPAWPSEIVPLLEEHGFLELRRKVPAQTLSTDHEILLYKPGSSAPIPIQGFKAADAQSLGWRWPIWVDWKGAYFVFSVGVRNSVPNNVWWLFPDGRTERAEMPFGSWNDYSRTSAQFYPIRCGMLVNLSYRFGELLQLRQETNPATKRQRFVDPRQLLPAKAWQVSVSPDGTRVAVAVGATSIPSGNPSTLKVIDVCRQ